MRFVLSLCIGFLFTLQHVSAQPTDNAPTLPGWTEDGLTLSGADVNYSSPVIAEIDGDPTNGKEVAIGSADGVMHVFKSDGTLLWSAPTPNHACAGASDNNKLLSGPAVGELFGNGKAYVVVGYGGVGGRSCDGGVIAFAGADGAVLWTFSLKAFSRKESFGTNSYTVFSSPALADTDGDGKMEVGFGSFDRNVYLLNADGSVRWYYNAADTIWSSPAFANVDKDPNLEMLIGTDISANSRLRPPTRNGGYVYAFKTAARKPTRISFRSKDAYVWQRPFNQVIYSSPVVADVLAESPGQEVIVQSGCFFPQNKNNKLGRWIKVMRLSDGKILKTIPIPACSPSAVAVGDLDEDGVLEIVATVNGHSSIGGDGSSRLMAFKANNPNTPLWSIIPRERGRNDEYGGNFVSPVIADIDGNGSLEVLVSNGSAVGVFNGRDGSALTCQGGSCDEGSSILFAFDNLRSTPAIGDINGDGILDAVVGGGARSGRSGALYGWTNLNEVLASPAGILTPWSMPWPMWRGNAAHTAKHIP